MGLGKDANTEAFASEGPEMTGQGWGTPDTRGTTFAWKLDVALAARAESDAELQGLLKRFHDEASETVTPGAQGAEDKRALLVALGTRLGGKLADLLPGEADAQAGDGAGGAKAAGRTAAATRQAIVDAVRTPTAGSSDDSAVPALVLRASEDLAPSAADKLLTLPWELLYLPELAEPEEGPALDPHPVRAGLLDVIRDAQAPDQPHGQRDRAASTLPEHLTVGVVIAAPEGQTPLPYEDEASRLVQIFEHRGNVAAAMANLGELTDLGALVRQHHPTVVHFSGHGAPGALLFEDAVGGPALQPVHAVLDTLREAGPLPRLLLASACHGADTGTATGRQRDGQRDGQRDDPAVVATLHRGGVEHVLGYFGAVLDTLATVSELALYDALGAGAPVRAAARAARRAIAACAATAPLSWAQLQLFAATAHTDAQLDRPLVAPPTGAPSGAPALTGLLRDTAELAVSGLPVLRAGFIGRRRAIHMARRMLRGLGESGGGAGTPDTPGEPPLRSPLVIQGLGGLGKTALATHLLATELAPSQPLAAATSVQPSVLATTPADFAPWRLVLNVAQANEQARASRPDTASIPADGEARDLAVVRHLVGQVVEHGATAFGEDTPRDASALHSEAPAGPWAATSKALREGAVQRFPRDPLAQELFVFQGLVRRLQRKEPGLVVYLDNLESLQVDLDAAGAGEDGEPGAALSDWRSDAARRFWEAVEALAKREAGSEPQPGLQILATTRYAWRGLPEARVLHLAPLPKAEALRLVDTLPIPEPVRTRPALRRVWPLLMRMLADKAGSRPRTLVRLGGLLATAVDRSRPRAEREGPEADFLRALASLLAQSRSHAPKPGLSPEAFAKKLSELLDTWLGARWEKLHDDLLLAKLWALLGSQERTYALALLVLGSPAPEDVLDRVAGAVANPAAPAASGAKAPESLRAALVRSSLLTHVPVYRRGEAAGGSGSPGGASSAGPHHEARWTYEQAVRAFLAQQEPLTEEAQRQAAEAAGLAYLERSRTTNRSTAVDLHEGGRLLLQAGRGAEAWELLRPLVVHLRDQAQWRQALAVLAMALKPDPSASGLQADTRAEALTLVVQQRVALGHYDKRAKDWGGTTLLDQLREAQRLATRDQTRGFVLHQLAVVLEKQGRHTEAEEAIRQSLEIDKQTVGTKHPSHGTSLHQLAKVLAYQDRHKEAEKAIRESLDIKKLTVGTEHPDYAAGLHELASVLESQGRYDEADEAIRESLDIHKRTAGTDHPDYAASLHQLAIVLEKQGRYDEAEKAIRESLDIKKRAVGANHPDYAASLHQLAIVLEEQGRYEEAEKAVRESLDIKKRAVGIDDPGYSASLYQLASILEAQAHYEEAEEAIRRCLEIDERTVGTSHTSYATCLHELAIILQEQGRYAEAEKAVRESLDIKKRTMAAGHPHLAASHHVLAEILHRQDRSAEAEEAIRESLRILKGTLGTNHPSYAASLHLLARVLQRQGRYQDAEEAIRESLNIKKRTPGLDPSSYAASLFMAGQIVFVRGRQDEGLKMVRQAEHTYRRTLGRHHPDTQRVHSTLLKMNARKNRQASS